MTLRRCYKPTVNESETITDAQEFCPVLAQNNGPRAQPNGYPAVHVERS